MAHAGREQLFRFNHSVEPPAGSNPDARCGAGPDPFIETKNMQSGLFRHRQYALPYFFSRAREEKALVAGCSGLNTHVLMSEEQVRRMNESGISVIWMALPPERYKQNFMDGYIHMARQFFTSPHSPARSLFLQDMPRYIMTHSTGGLLYWTIKQSPRTLERLQSLYAGEIHIAPYFDSANASRDHATSFRRKVFELYARLHHNHTPMETLLGRTYLSRNAARERLISRPPDICPTFGQIREVQQAGRTLTESFNPAASGSTAPCTIILGERDPFACHKTAKEFALRVGARLHLVEDGGHAPLDQAPELFDAMIHSIATNADRYHKVRQAHPIADIGFATWNLLRYGAGIALQSGTRFLDSTTGFLEEFFGGCVGNPEMGGQPESHALHGGNAFGFEKIGYEVAVGLDHLAVRSPFADATGARRVNVESPFGFGANDPARFVEHGHDQIAARLK